MTGRERELAAIRREGTDRIPLDVICIEIVPEIAAFLGIGEGEVHDALGIDGRIVAAGWTGEPRVGAQGTPLTEWGTPGSGDWSRERHYPLAEAATIADVERYAFPDPAHYDFAGAARAVEDLGVPYAVRGPHWLPLFWRLCDLFGIEAAMVNMLSSRGVFEAALDRVFAHTFDYSRRLLNACGDAMPILCLGDDFATQRGLMISPDDWRRWLKPRFARLFELGRSRGKVVWFHSCGDITSILPDLIDIGVDVWETVQLHTLPMSASALKREFGRHLTFFGGVNTQRLPFASPEEVCHEVLDCIRVLGEGGGYICGPDHHIKPDVPPANAVALFEAGKGASGSGNRVR